MDAERIYMDYLLLSERGVELIGVAAIIYENTICEARAALTRTSSKSFDLFTRNPHYRSDRPQLDYQI